MIPNRWPFACMACLMAMMALTCRGFQVPSHPRLPNFDKRTSVLAGNHVPTQVQAEALASLHASDPDVVVDFDPLLGTPRFVHSRTGFLTRPGVALAARSGEAGKDPYGPTKAFLEQHRALFGFGPEALAGARVKRDFVTAHNGLHTVVWEQQLDEIPIFGAVAISHTTRRGELVNLTAQFLAVPAVAASAGTTHRAALLQAPAVSAQRATALAASDVGDAVEAEAVLPAEPATDSQGRRQFTAAGIAGPAYAELVWLPMSGDVLRLCWEVIFTSRSRGEMFRVLVDAQTREALVRQCLTANISDATYRVFTSDSPSPFSPGHPTPLTNQPPLVARSLMTFSALDTNASPAGWINDTDNETRGNNVDAHLDRNGDDQADLPRPQGSPPRVFDFPQDLTQSPATYGDAAVVQLFYWCNWMHDRLYELGFTEAAGNFQTDNFGRGGFGNDRVSADAQDGGGVNNANMGTPPDGLPPRMQMYLFTGPTPARDGDLDAEIICHEYVHGLSTRRVGGGVGIYELQTSGMGEGWSDFYALSLLGEAADDVHGVYANGGYLTYLFLGLQQNYYFGIRRYPYSTDLAKHPLTFKDIDPLQASPHDGVPVNPRFYPFNSGLADEVHNQGEVWCAMLWEARANLIDRLGYALGNRLSLQLVTDGMNLCPPNPTYVQARDAILQADLVNNAGTNRNDLWAAFAKRGLGFSATAPIATTTIGVREAYDLPDDLFITPNVDYVVSGPVGGPFAPGPLSLTLANLGTNDLNWTVGHTSAWLTVSVSGGSLPPVTATNVTLGLATGAGSLAAGIYDDFATFTNLTSGIVKSRHCRIRVGQPDYYTAVLSDAAGTLTNRRFTFTPDGNSSFYSLCTEAAAGFATAPEGGNAVSLTDDAYAQVTLAGTNTISIYGHRTNVFFIGSNGYLTLREGDTDWATSISGHFELPRVSALFEDLNPSAGGSISWRQLSNRVAVTYQNIRRYGSAGAGSSFQVELFFDGRIHLTYLKVSDQTALIGLSRGTGIPYGFADSDFQGYAACPLPLALTLPAAANEGAGVLAGMGLVAIPSALTNDLLVSLVSSNTAKVVVPSGVLIPAGQTNVAFDLTLLDDGLLDGTRPVTVSSWAAGYLFTSTAITIFDKETALLSLSLPTPVIENAGTAQGTLQVSAPPAADVVVALASSHTNKILVPAAVVIAAGQTSAVFTAQIVDNTLIDGAQSVTVTAHVQNWTDGVAAVSVADNEDVNLVVVLPSQAREGDGVLTNAGTVQLSGTLPTNFIVSLHSSDVTELAVPGTVTIFAGARSNAFDLGVAEDWDPDGPQVVSVTASATGFVDGMTAMTILDVDVPPMPFAPDPPDLCSNILATASLAWSSGRSAITNDVYFGTHSTPGPMDYAGTTTNSTWALPLLDPATTYYWRVVAHHVGSTTGAVWRFTTRGPSRFEWDPVASPQYVGQPFVARVTVKDEFGRVVTNFAGPAALTAFTAPPRTNLFYDNFEDGALSDWNAGQGSYVRSLTDQTAASGSWSLSLTGGASNLFDGLAHSLPSAQPSRIEFSVRGSATNVTGGCFAAGAGASEDQSAVFFCLNRDGTMGLRDGLSAWRGWPYLAGRWYRIALDFDWLRRRVDWSVDGALVATGVTFRGNVDHVSQVSLFNVDPTQTWWDAIVVNSGSQPPPAPITPTNATPFTGGAWSGQLTVLEADANLYLVADDGAGHSGVANPFSAVVSNDLSLAVSTSASTVVVGSNLTFTTVVANPGPLAASQVRITNVLAEAVTFVSATASQGTWSRLGRTVICEAGTIPAGATASFSITVIPAANGVLTNIARVTRAEPDPVSSNNLASVAVEVRLPAGAFVFSAPLPVGLPDLGAAFLYPSTNPVVGVFGEVTNVTATLSDLNHAHPADLALLLVGPGGENVMLMNGVGGSNAAANVTMTFDDLASAPPPQFGPIASGRFRCVDYAPGLVLPLPAPAGPFGNALAAFNATDPNGLWQLFAYDGQPGAMGLLAGGWSLQIETSGAVPPAPLILDPSFSGGQFGFHFSTVAGHGYAVEFKSSLDEPIWELREIVAGDGTDKWVLDSNAGGSPRFYRIRVQ